MHKLMNAINNVTNQVQQLTKLLKPSTSIQSYFEEWPVAVHKDDIVDRNNEIEKMERGRGIVQNWVQEDLRGLKYLDFGCGEGHTVLYAQELGATAFGYDRQLSDVSKNVTNDWNTIIENSPYDVIMCFDVMDHLIQLEPTQMLRMIHDVLTENGKIYMQVHPWISRHGTHLYNDFNKAFAHLVLTDTELKEFAPNHKPIETLKVRYPLKTYANYFQQANLKVLNTQEIRNQVEPFFQKPEIANRIVKNTGMSELPIYQMSLTHVIYTLCKP